MKSLIRLSMPPVHLHVSTLCFFEQVVAMEGSFSLFLDWRFLKRVLEIHEYLLYLNEGRRHNKST